MHPNQSETKHSPLHQQNERAPAEQGVFKFTIALPEQQLRRALFVTNGFGASILIAGLLSILAAQHIYETSIGADDDLIEDAIDGFRWRRIPIWLVPSQLFKIACAFVGIYESRSARKTADDCQKSIVLIGIAAASFAFDFGLSVSFLHVGKLMVSLICLLPHLMLLELMHRRRQTLGEAFHDKVHVEQV